MSRNSSDRYPLSKISEEPSKANLISAPPVTRFVLRLDGIVTENEWRSCSGRLLVKLTEADYRLRDGDRIEAVGWLSNIRGPDNPGETDYRASFSRRGIDGRITLLNRGNWRLLATHRRSRSLDQWHLALADHAAWSLRLGMRSDSRNDVTGNFAN